MPAPDGSAAQPAGDQRGTRRPGRPRKVRTFTATHGVQFSEPDPDTGLLRTWAHFTRDRDRDAPDGSKVYRFSTDDAAVAERLRKVDDYGITEVSDVHGDDAG